jgi:hypothetical protein
MKENIKKHLSLKVLLALLPTLIFYQNYAWMTGNAYLGIGFIIIWILMIWNVHQFTEKNHILERFFRLTEISFFLLPVSALILTFIIGSRVLSSSVNEFEQAGGAIGTAIGGVFIIIIAFIIGVAGGIIMHLITKKYEKKAEASGIKKIENSSIKHGVIISLVVLIALAIVMGSISSAQNTARANKAKEELSKSLQQGSVTKTDTVSLEENKTQSNKVKLEILKKGFSESDFSSGNYYPEQITMNLKFTNETDKDIKGVEGTLTLYDIFDNKISSTSVGYDKSIPAHQNKVWESGIDYNQFIDEDVKLKNTELENLKYKWEVQTIIYADGSKEIF